MRHLINRPIGPGLDNDPDDIRIVRGTLRAMKGEDINPETLSGFIDDDLDADIRHFQQDAGLVEDGKLSPDGETERNLISRITGDSIDVAAREDAVLQQSVGDGGENDPADVVAAKRALGTLGYLKYDRTAAPSPFIDSDTVAALTEFQNDTKLFPDGRADPDGKTIEALREALGEVPDRSAPGETKVAVGPLMVPLLLTLVRTAPHLAKFARGAAAVGASSNAARQAGQKTRERQGDQRDPDEGSDFARARPESSKVENIPPNPNRYGGGRTEFPPEDPDGNDGKLEGRPAEPIIDIPAGFPIPDSPEDLVEILPGNTDKIELPIFIERRGKESTRAYNADVTRLFESAGKQNGLQVQHIGGSRDANGREVPETHFKNRDTGGLKGGSFADMSFWVWVPGKGKIEIHINTADTRADGMTLTTREKTAAIRLLYNMKKNALLITIAKAGPNETIDLDAMEKLIDPVMKGIKDAAENGFDRDTVERWIDIHQKLPTK